MLRHFVTHRMLYALICCLLLSLPSVASAKIVFVSSRDGVSNLYVMEDDGSNVQRLAFSQADKYEGAPAWSPDGKRIAFWRNVSADKNISNYELFMVNRDGSKEQQLTDHPAQDGRFQITWAPDGRRFAFSSNRRGSREIHVIDILTRRVRQLTHSGGNVFTWDPSWSPDGKYIAYKEVPPRGGLTTIIWVMNADGTEQHPLVPERISYGFSPCWSPDSKSVMYCELLSADPEEKRFNSFYNVVIQKHGAKDRQVLKTPKAWSIWCVSWMDSGKQVLIAAKNRGDQNPQYDIYSYNLSDGIIINLTNHPEDDRSPDWISDNVLSVTPLGKEKTLWGKLKK